MYFVTLCCKKGKRLADLQYCACGFCACFTKKRSFLCIAIFSSFSGNLVTNPRLGLASFSKYDKMGIIKPILFYRRAASTRRNRSIYHPARSSLFKGNETLENRLYSIYLGFQVTEHLVLDFFSTLMFFILLNISR